MSRPVPEDIRVHPRLKPFSPLYRRHSMTSAVLSPVHPIALGKQWHVSMFQRAGITPRFEPVAWSDYFQTGPEL